MKQFSLADYNAPTKILWFSSLALSIAAFMFAAFGVFDFGLTQFIILGVSLIVAAVVNQHQFKIPGTKLTVSAREALIFWGIIWLGLPGGAFLAVGSSLAAYGRKLKDKRRWTFGAFACIISSVIAAKVFYVFLNFAGFDFSAVATQKIPTFVMLQAIALASIVYFLLYNGLGSLFYKLNDNDSIGFFWKKNLGWALGSLGIGIFFTVSLYYTFLKFGISFGLVVLPAVVFGHLGYRIYLQKLAQKTREITEANRIHVATVEALATAIDARDQVGIGHVRRTQIYAVGIGEALGLSEDEIQALNTGALLHDIGKLAVPDHILNKPAELTPAEMEKMKIHATVGAEILERVNFPYPVVPTVKFHHELWDGSGYPLGLKKDEIPLTARILTLADSYDTLRGARPYRAGVSREDARKFLLHGAGTRFDPKLVDVFLRNLRHFEAEVDARGLSYSLDPHADEELLSTTDSGDGGHGYVGQIKRANREVFALYELARVFSSSLNLQETLSLFVQKIGELMPFDTCVVYLLDKTGDAATAAHAEGRNAAALKGRRIKPGEGASGYVLKKREAAFNINPAMDFSFCQLEFMQDYTAMASLPLIGDGKLIGAVSLYSCELECYEEEHMRLLETVSRIASDAISKTLYHAETESHALTDPMTNLPNARCLQMQFETEVARAQRSNSQFQVIMLDLDGFKKVNDTFGHKIGDLLLKELAKVMRDQLREYDFLARYAGDEFVAMIPDTNKDAIGELCERIERSVLDFRLPVGDGREARVGVSVGAACYPKDGETLDQVIIAADKAMYSVKASHKQKQAARETPPQEASIQEATIHVLPTVQVPEEAFIVELDESHIISSAIN